MKYSVEDAERELKKVETKLVELEDLQKRALKLREFISIGKHLSNGEPQDFLPEAKSSQPQAVGKTVSMAERALLMSRPLHMDQLLRRVRELGWAGSGDDTKDKKSIYVALLRSPRFTNKGKNIWTLNEKI